MAVAGETVRMARWRPRNDAERRAVGCAAVPLGCQALIATVLLFAFGYWAWGLFSLGVTVLGLLVVMRLLRR
jgi:hypothetical protein